jgi:hypothetical protein
LRTLKIFGKASQRIIAELPVEDASEVLMFFLLRHNLPIASSCAGDGVCKKCELSDGRLSCQMSVEEALSNGPIDFNYL